MALWAPSPLCATDRELERIIEIGTRPLWKLPCSAHQAVPSNQLWSAHPHWPQTLAYSVSISVIPIAPPQDFTIELRCLTRRQFQCLCDSFLKEKTTHTHTHTWYYSSVNSSVLFLRCVYLFQFNLAGFSALDGKSTFWWPGLTERTLTDTSQLLWSV